MAFVRKCSILARHSAQTYYTHSSTHTSSSSWHGSSGIAAIGVVMGGTAFYSLFQSQLFSSEPSASEAERDNSKGTERKALNPKEWVSFKLEEAQIVSHNTKLLRFVFDPDQKLGLEVASCLLTRAQSGTNTEGKPNYIIRPYTPISDPEAKGYFDLMIKIYPQGKMSQHIGSLQPGDTLEVKGPISKLPYKPNMKKSIGMIYPQGKMSQHIGSLQPGDTLEVKGPISKLPYKPNMKKSIGMVAGGTGITPMLQVIDAILKDPNDLTKIFLIYANVSPDDILLKEKLDLLQAANPNFKVYYVVDKASKDWRGGIGYITKDMIVKGLPPPSEDILVLVCGPPGMMKHISGDKEPDKSQGELTGLLKEAGYTKDMVFKF